MNLCELVFVVIECDCVMIKTYWFFLNIIFLVIFLGMKRSLSQPNPSQAPNPLNPTQRGFVDEDGNEYISNGFP